MNMLDYVENYGKYSFAEFPFNEIDALIFSQLSYVELENIVEDKPIFLMDAVTKFYRLHSDEEIENMIGISSKAVNLMSLCAKTHRFDYVKLCRYVNNINDSIDKQFSAVNFVINNDDLVVAFRGTDITVTGVKESAMLSYMFPVPAQIEALHYFQEAAMMQRGNVYVCGHSKGGNLAVFAAVNCSNSLKKRIRDVYEFDAPGFPEWFFERYDYKQIESHIHFYAPQASLFGRLLKHNKRPIIVKSTNEGIKQHQVSSWVVGEATLQTVDSFNQFSDFMSGYVNNLIEIVGEDDLEKFFDTVEFLVTKMGIEDFYDLKSVDIRKAHKLIDTVTDLTPEQKENFKAIVKTASLDLAKGLLKNYIGNFKKEQ